MNIYYHPQYNISLGLLNYLHPFDGRKFSRVFKTIKGLNDINIKQPEYPVSQKIINNFVGEIQRRLLHRKRYILRALEIPYIPLLPFSIIDKRILLPMRWGVGGTIAATTDALKDNNAWNLAGGYHHATPRNSQGFCIYNDIGIALQEASAAGLISETDKILIVDVDAHHGNGNAYTFMDNQNVTILDIYNNDVYPQNNLTKERVNINVPLAAGAEGSQYNEALKNALGELKSDYRIAYVIAGTDVLASDPLGGLGLSVPECVERDKMVYEKLLSLSIPTVFVGGGGYSSESAQAIIESIKCLHRLDEPESTRVSGIHPFSGFQFMPE
ncbi:MAG: histone deacetylase [Gammaproteobacteria bacterium]|nr:histone deacetylase [Gammaproteobacteria bacterium]